MSITTAVVLVVLILVGFSLPAGTLVALALIRGWVDVRQGSGPRPLLGPSANSTSSSDQAPNHPIFGR